MDIRADLNDDDGSGYLWTFLDEARHPSLVKAGAVLVAGSEDTAAMCEVTRLESAGDGSTIVHLRVLPGTVEDYLGAAGRALVN